MAEVNNPPGVTQDDLLAKYRSVSGVTDATVDDMFSNVMSAKAAFVTTAPITIAQLLANYPAGPATLFKYARVSDLYGAASSLMVCEASMGQHYWRPQRTDYAAAAATTSGSVTLTPLLSAPTTIFTGTLLGSVNIVPSTTNVWPGARFEVVANGVLGLFNISIGGLVGGGTVPLLSGSSRIITYVQGSGWRAG